ncbi:hypothetical protein [Moorena sp. SIO3H5]|uniref:hypothetical protein n=1 Tax=Moorena sp. SIO3H5 TaxID=2607834 RepID=UPI0013B8835B|nr:hypothetical protein [Moorena sp. SIO3H5]NEO69628.1 hypothetical protein [Moorena sp. SIO3H5]
MRYRLFFPSSLLPAPCSLLPAPCCLLPAPCSLKPRDLYLIARRIAILNNWATPNYYSCNTSARSQSSGTP